MKTLLIATTLVLSPLALSATAQAQGTVRGAERGPQEAIADSWSALYVTQERPKLHICSRDSPTARGCVAQTWALRRKRPSSPCTSADSLCGRRREVKQMRSNSHAVCRRPLRVVELVRSRSRSRWHWARTEAAQNSEGASERSE